MMAVGGIAEVFIGQVSAFLSKFASAAPLGSAYRYLLRISVMREFLDVVHHAVELPLRIDFALAPERKAIKTLVVAQVAKHRFHRGDAPAVLCAALG